MTTQKILIVEDELGVAQPLKRALDLNTNNLLQIEICSTAEDALEQMRAKHFDLLVTDFRLPGMDGLKLLEQAHRINPDILSVLISAYGSPDLETRVQKLASAYIPKPYHLRDIIKVIQNLLLSAQASDGVPEAQVEAISNARMISPQFARQIADIN